MGRRLLGRSRPLVEKLKAACRSVEADAPKVAFSPDPCDPLLIQVRLQPGNRSLQAGHGRDVLDLDRLPVPIADARTAQSPDPEGDTERAQIPGDLSGGKLAHVAVF